MLLFVLACESDPSKAPVVCEPRAPSVERADLPTGYRVLDAPVTADWLAEDRTVPVSIWYPTDETTGENPVYQGLFSDPQSIIDAAFVDPAPACLLPLVVYSHGSQAWAGNGSPLLRHLVAQGWIAVAPDHVGNTLLDNVEPRPISYSLTRTADVRAAIDLIEALPADDPLAGRVDTSRVLVTGHSFGGQTAWLLAGPELDTETVLARCDADEVGCTEAERAAFAAPVEDSRVAAVLPMDGFAGEDLVSPAGWASASRPIYYLNRSGEGDSEPFETAAAADVRWAVFEGACHETFTATTLPCDSFDKEEGLDLVAAYQTAFGASTVLGQSGAPYAGILDGSTVLDPRVTVHLP